MISGLPTAYFDALLNTGGVEEVTWYAEVWNNRGTVKSGTLEVIDLSVTLDYKSAVRSTCSITTPGFRAYLPDVAWVGTDRDYGSGDYGTGIYGDHRHSEFRGILKPQATQLRLYETRKYNNGDTTTISLGRYTIGDPTYSLDTGPMTITITGWDLAGDFQKAKFSTPFTIAKNTNIATAITNILENRILRTSGGTTYYTITLPTTSETTPKMVFLPGQGIDPWDECQKLAAAAGWQLYIDRNGNVKASLIPNPTDGVTTVWDFADTTNAVTFSHVQSGSEIFNKCVVVGGNSGDTPVTGSADISTGPFSITALGREIVREYRSDKARTSYQCTNIAISYLWKYAAIWETIAIESIPAPFLDPGDYVTVTSSELDLEEAEFFVDSVNISGAVGATTSVTVSRRLGGVA